MSGPLRPASRDLVKLVCPSCDDTIRVPADEIRPECKRCSILLSEPGSPCRRPHDFAVSEIRVKQHGETRCLIPTPAGFTEVPYYADDGMIRA